MHTYTVMHFSGSNRTVATFTSKLEAMLAFATLADKVFETDGPLQASINSDGSVTIFQEV